jgi:hypothetical protein
MAVQNNRGKQLTNSGCCDIVKINSGIKYFNLGNHGFKAKVDYCVNCGSIKSTSNIREHKIMSDNILFAEKAGKKLKAEIFKTENGAGIRFFINEEFLKEEIYEDKSIEWANSIGEKWMSTMTVLNG